MDNRQQYPNYDYSTLEVAQQQHGEHTQTSSPQPDYGQHGYATGGYPEQAYQTDPRKYSPQPYEGHNLPQVVDPVYPEVAPKPDAAAIGTENAPKGDYAGYGDHQHVQHPVPAPAERRIWGLKRKTFFVVLAVVLLVVIGAAVGGGVGGTVGKNSEKKSDPSTGGGAGGAGGGGGGGGDGGGGSSPGNTTNNSPVLGNSSISAINWTDSSNVEFNAVFWQAKTTDLMMSLWDSQGNAWDQVNITDKMGATSVNVTAKPGTPLAAAARGYPWTVSKLKNVAGDFGIALFYLSPQNTILEVYSTDPRGGSWKLGDLTTSSSNTIKTASNSQLGAWWGLCETNCSGNILLAYEDENQALRIANSSTWNTASVLRNIADGASLSITACAGNRGLDGPAQNAVRLYYDSSNKLSELMWTTGGPWYYGLTSPLTPTLPLFSTRLLTSLSPSQAPTSRPASRRRPRKSQPPASPTPTTWPPDPSIFS